MICEICGAEMEYFEEGSSCGQKCPNCDWAIVTTKLNPMFADKKVYTIRLLSENEVNGLTLKAVSKVCGVNYIAAKEIIGKDCEIIFSGRASEVVGKKALLDEGGVKYTIIPAWPH